MESANRQFAREILDGLSVGDAFGEALSYRFYEARTVLSSLNPDMTRFRYTDDTEMACALFDAVSQAGGVVDEDHVALLYAGRYRRDPDRGYGRMARKILEDISMGDSWREVSANAFGGGGSFGNGAAMRVGPLGGFFHDDLEKTAVMAERSARVTHHHPEGIAGAVAVAIAAAVAVACRDQNESPGDTAARIRQSVQEKVLAGTTAQNIAEAFEFAPTASPLEVARTVGNGAGISAQDTVPFCLWNACRCLDNYREAILSTVEVGGDCDTNCAIVGGIVAGYGGSASIPPEWLAMREPLSIND